MQRPRVSRRVWFASAALLYSAALVTLRGRPSIRADAGIFLSVGAMLTRGTRLYAGVWDNKPPLFYYDYAVAFLAGGWRGPFVLDIAWVWLSCVALGMLLHALGASRLSTAVGVVVYPVLLTGAWYYAGYSELPSLALVTVAAWLWMRGSPRAAGIAVGLIIFMHPEYAVLAVAVMATPVVTGTLRGRRLWSAALGALSGVAASAAAVIVVMLIRGELGAYATTMWNDIGYPDRKLATMGLSSGVAGHATMLRRLVDDDAIRQACLLLSVVWGIAWWLLWRRAQRRVGAPMRHSELQSPLVVCWGLATLSTAGVLIWTVLFPHDLQIVALPGVLAICMAVAWIETARQRREVTLVAVALTIAVGVIAFGGVRISGLANGGSAESAQPLSEWTRTPVSVTARLLDRGAMITGKRGTLTYARLGTNNDDAHGAFDAGDIRLACPVFAQYPFSVNLDQTLTCLVRTHPDLVVEGPGFAPSTPQRTGSTGSGYAADWTAFVDQSLAVLRKNYVRLGTAQDVGGVVSVWCARQVCPVPTPTGSEPR